jgi:plasmid stability protein
MVMAQLLIRNLEDDVKAKLRDRARIHGRSTEEEVREILRNAVRDEARPSEPLGKRLRSLFRGIGLDEDIPEWRGHSATPADLS